MMYRPWPILILAFFHVTAPLWNFIFSSWMSGMSWADYASTFQNPLETFMFFGALPLAGIAIYLCRWWSFPVFLFAMGWSFYTGYHSRELGPEQFPKSALLAAYIFNFAVVAYFLIPSVRTVYINRRVRWWEAKPRYFVPIPVLLRFGNQEEKAIIENVSERGALVQSALKFSDGDLVDVEFEHEGQRVKGKAEVVHARQGAVAGKLDYGFQYVSFSEGSERAMRALIATLEKKGVTRRPERINRVSDFFKWAKEASRGRGIIPAVPEQFKKPKR